MPPPIVKLLKMSLVVEGRNDIDLDLQGDISKLKEKPITMKEGTQYTIKLQFTVEREVVAGLMYHHQVHRQGINGDKSTYMVGTYGPKSDEPQEWTSQSEGIPKGLLYRGEYEYHSKIYDVTKHIIGDWYWSVHIKKDWD